MYALREEDDILENQTGRWPRYFYPRPPRGGRHNYESCGTPNCRNTNICLAHKARCLAVCYYVNKRSLIIGDTKPKKIYLPREEAVQLIGEDATAALWTLAEEAKNNVEVKI